MSKDQKTTSEIIVENVDIIESILLSYKVLLENNTVINAETKEEKKMCDIFPFNVEYKVLKHILKDSRIDK